MNVVPRKRFGVAILLLLDTIVIVSTVVTANYVWLSGPLYLSDYHGWFLPVLLIAAFASTGTYTQQFRTNVPRVPLRTFWVAFITGMVYLAASTSLEWVADTRVLPGSAIIFIAVASGLFATLIRVVINAVVAQQASACLYLGYSPCTEKFISDSKNLHIVSPITIATTEKPDRIRPDIDVSEESLTALLALPCDFNLIVLDPDFNANASQRSQLVALKLAGKEVLTLASFYEQKRFLLPLDYVGERDTVLSESISLIENPTRSRIKRSLDVMLSIILLILTLPLLILCALLISLTSHGPIFFSQTRTGLKGKAFQIYKLRTMDVDAEAEGARWAMKDDPRITTIGTILRRTRLDELPQFLNVLRGDMSLVGPRPERPEFTDELRGMIPHYDLRHLVKPGITGWAQILFPYGASVEDARIKLQYDLYYVKNQSMMLDFTILLKTVRVIFQQTGH